MVGCVRLTGVVGQKMACSRLVFNHVEMMSFTDRMELQHTV